MNSIAIHAATVAEVKGMKPEEGKLWSKVITWLQQCENSTSEMEYRTVAEEDLEFYAGRQDTLEVLQALEDQKRPAEVYNEVKPKVDMVIGMGAQMQQEAQVVPVGVEDEPLAELMNKTLKHYRNELGLEYKELEAFEHVVKSGRCLAQVYASGENPFSPEIKIKIHRGHRFFVDPDFLEYDLSDARFLFVDIWVDEEEAKALFPSFTPEEIKTFTYNAPTYYPEFWNEANEKYRVVECWYREVLSVYWYINPMTGKPDWVEKKRWKDVVSAIEEINNAVERGKPGMEQQQQLEMPVPVEGFKRVVKRAVFSGSGLLSYGANPYLYEDYPFVFFGGYRDDNKNNWFGVVTMMKDPQRGLNTMRRQLMHLLQTSPKGILMHEVGAIINIEEYEKRSADPTYHMELKQGGLGQVKFTDQPQISPIYNVLDGTYVQSMKDSSGIQDNLMGIQTTSREPGVSVRLRQEAGVAVLRILFSNFVRSRHRLAKILMYMIKQYVREEKLLRIVGPSGMELVQINSQMNPQSEGFNDISSGEYDLRIDDTIESTTMRLAIGQWLTDFAMNNPGVIPPDVILEYAGLPFSVKSAVQQYTAQMQQMQQQQAQAQMAMEAKKLEIEEKKVMGDLAAKMEKNDIEEMSVIANTQLKKEQTNVKSSE